MPRPPSLADLKLQAERAAFAHAITLLNLAENDLYRGRRGEARARINKALETCPEDITIQHFGKSLLEECNQQARERLRRMGPFA